jgi:carbamoylphosphate synthase large subunit
MNPREKKSSTLSNKSCGNPYLQNSQHIKIIASLKQLHEQGLIQDTNTYKKIEALTKINEEIKKFNNSSNIQSLKHGSW